MSIFDPDAFLDQEVSGANATHIIPCPEYDEVSATIKPGTIKVQQKDRKDGDGKVTFCNLQWIINDPVAQETTGRDEVIVRQTLFIDLTDDGAIASGDSDNVQLGKLREATGLNDGAFSFRMLEGQSAMVKVAHGDPQPNGETYAEIRGVKAAA
jgi:hypothetical protein